MISQPHISSSKKRLTVRLYIVIESVKRKLGKIEQSPNTLVWAFPPTSRGLHVTYHDANASHARGAIWLSLDKGWIYGPTPDLRRKGVQITPAPAFAEITSIQEVWISPHWVNSGLRGFPEVNRREKADHIIQIDLDMIHASHLQVAIFFVSPGQEGALLNRLEQLEELEIGRPKIEVVKVFDAFVPWTAVVIRSVGGM